MGMTITEKILARASNKERVDPGEIIIARVDKVMIHDVSGPPALKILEDLGVEKVFDPSRVWVTEDHFVPPPDTKSAKNLIELRRLAEKYGLRKYYRWGVGQYGVCHALCFEEALVAPGEVFIGGDSHTNTAGGIGSFAAGMGHTDIAFILKNGWTWLRVPETLLFKINGKLREHVMAKDLALHIIGEIGASGASYKAMEFKGEGIKNMNLEERLTLCNMTTEAGAKNGIIEPDEKTIQYFKERGVEFKPICSDEDAEYLEKFSVDASKIEPMVAKPVSPANSSPVSEDEGLEIDRVYIGSCTGGKLFDLRMAARIMKNRRVKIRTEIAPATQSIYLKALNEGLIEIFAKAGAIILPPTCGACFGGHMGVLGEGEICVSTTNRNFPGRMGHRSSKVYLVSPLTAAASAITGRLTNPREFLHG